MMDLNLHTQVENFEIRDNCLCIGGEKVTAIADRLGPTPFYVYDRALLRRRVDRLRSAIPAEISLHYAIKANPMPELVCEIAALVDGLDVASGGELSIALRSSTRPGDISFAGPGKTVEELAVAVGAGIVINIESRTELERILVLTANSSVEPKVAVRVNPDFELKSSGMKMSGGPKQFGIDAELVPQLLQDMAQMPIQFEGFHIFSGSQNLRADSICESQTKAVELAIELSKYAPKPPSLINIGGGFGIPYFPGDSPLDLSTISRNLKSVSQLVSNELPGSELALELGRYIVGEAGLYICRVLDKKISRGHVYLITDGGLHHHLAASGNFGQVIRKNYPVLIANNVFAEKMENVSVVGPLCTPLDILADRMDMGNAEIGDLVAVFQSGAYGYSASPHLFLGHPPPRQVLQ